MYSNVRKIKKINKKWQHATKPLNYKTITYCFLLNLQVRLGQTFQIYILAQKKGCKTTHSSITIGRRQSDHLIVIGQQFEGDSLTL
jgi:hypothetical protein